MSTTTSSSSNSSPAIAAATATTASASVDTDNTMILLVPKPNKIIKYKTCNYDSVLYLYGNSSCEKIALCCAGYADDHTVFQPFANELAKQGNTFVGVICLPGYDDRPEDGVSWTTHNKDGYTYNDWSNSIRDAVKALRSKSTYINGIEKTKFTGIFHDWGVVGGTIWLNRTLKEYDELLKESEKTNQGDDGTSTPQDILFKPNNVVYLDVLLPPPSSKLNDLPPQDELALVVTKPTMKQLACEWLYKIVLAKSFVIQRYISKYIAGMYLIVAMYILNIFNLDPLYNKFDIEQSIKPLYIECNKKKSIYNLIYMAYPYWYMFKNVIFNNTNTNTNNNVMNEFILHSNWKATPILYMYGIKKKTNFHNYTSIALLEREEKLSLSTSKVIAVEDAGHFLYVQKQDICLDAIIKFMDTTA